MITALRSSDAQPYTYSRIFIPEDISRGLPADLVDRAGSAPVLSLIEECCGVPAHRALQVASAVSASRDLANQLDVPEGSALLVLERTYYSREGRPIEHAQIYCRPDRYRQSVEFMRQPHLPERTGEVDVRRQ
jgi:GntR family transcriptional regulator